MTTNQLGRTDQETLIHALMCNLIDHAGNAQFACVHDARYTYNLSSEIRSVCDYALAASIAATLDDKTAYKLSDQLNFGLITTSDLCEHLCEHL